jgi:flagellar hook-associated protein 2
VLFTQLKGNDGLLKSLGDIGITLNSDGKLQVDDARLDGLVASDLTAISSVFRSTGTTSIKELSFIGGTSKTKPSGTPGYEIFISALAQKLSAGAVDAQAGPLAQQEVLTFSGAAFSGGSYEIVLDVGMTQSQIVDKINGDAKLKGIMTASTVGGKLQLDAKDFGTAAAFDVMSNVATGGSGWGAGVVLQAAADIQGTINGEEAVGAGLILTGKAGNTNTDGLQVKYTGSTTGVIGNVTYAAGISDLMTGIVAQLTDSANGFLTNNDKGIQDQIDGIAKQISFKEEQLDAFRAILQARFNRMEMAIAELQAQQARIASFVS